MVNDLEIALRALHLALVAARNMAGDTVSSDPVADIVDTLERIPLFIADAHVDRSEEVAEIFRLLADQYQSCSPAAAVAAKLRRAVE
jgi:hypothetical protein